MKSLTGMLIAVMVFMPAAWAEQDEGLEHMRAQMNMERGKEEELTLLQLDVERLKLELEKKKALSELGRVPISDGGTASTPAIGSEPSVVLRYILITSGKKEALLAVDGREVRGHEGLEVAGRVLKAITPEGVVLLAKDGQENFLSLNK